jgi:TatD DNase family protein
VSKKKKPPLPVLGNDISLVDTHCHLDMEAYNDDLEEVLLRAEINSVTTILTIGIDLKSSQRAVQIANKYKNIYAAVGIHPHHAEEVSPVILNDLQKLAEEKKVVAYGEIGIDTVKNYAPLAAQRDAFIRQLNLAKKLDLPVIIHDREAHEEVYSLLLANGPFPAGGVIHCFSGDSELALKFINLGFYISIPGVVTFKKAEMLQNAAANIPLDKILIETDGPFLAPVPQRGKRNEPLLTLYIAKKIAELKETTLDKVATQTTINAENLFGISVNTPHQRS